VQNPVVRAAAYMYTVIGITSTDSDIKWNIWDAKERGNKDVLQCMVANRLGNAGFCRF